MFGGATPDGSVWTANADGSGAKLLFDGGDACVAVAGPSWSPDGTKLAMVCWPDYTVHSSVAVLDIASMALTTVATVSQPEFLDNTPRWSPDGASIAFPILHWDPTGDHLDGSLVAVVPAAGGEVKRITTFDSFMSSPDWRPDGSELVMNSYDLGNIQTTDQPSNLYAIKPDGTGLRQLTHSSVDGSMRITLPALGTGWQRDDGVHRHLHPSEACPSTASRLASWMPRAVSPSRCGRRDVVPAAELRPTPSNQP